MVKLKELVQTYIEEFYSVKNEKTRKTKLSRLKNILECMSIYYNKSIEDLELPPKVNRRLLNFIFKCLKEKQFSPSYIKQTLIDFRRFLRKLVEEYEEFDLNTPPEVKFRHFEELLSLNELRAQPKKETFDKKELGKILNLTKRVKPKEFYILLKLLTCTGLRRTEVVNLSPNDLVEKEINGKKVYFLTVKKAKFNKSRYVPLICEDAKDLQMIIEHFKERQQTGQPLWLYRTKRTKKEKIINETTLNDFCKYLTKKTGIKVYPHKFRYTFITNLIDRGANPDFVANIVGHEDVSTTLNYYKVVNIEKELEKLQLI
jgi:integrase